MRILIAAWYNSPNSYVRDIADFLMQEECEVLCSKDVFWHTNVSFDIIHIQWPEQLFEGMKVEDGHLVLLKERIGYWKKKGAKIVSTLHNFLPHKKEAWHRALYDLVYDATDVIIHLGDYSSTLYPEKYNVIIPHPNYNRHIHVEEAYRDKRIENNYLCFGNIRDVKEEQQIIDGFLLANIKNSKLRIVNSLVGINRYGRIRQFFKRIKYKNYILKLKSKSIELIPGKVSSEQINQHFNWADIIISPRIDNLNSGVVFLGFSFGKPVIGPNVGNIAEVLKQDGNPVFEPLHATSVAEALKALSGSKAVEIGRANKKRSDEEFEPSRVAKKHYYLYKNLLGKEG